MAGKKKKGKKQESKGEGEDPSAHSPSETRSGRQYQPHSNEDEDEQQGTRLSLWSAPSPLQGPPNAPVISSPLSGAVYYGAHKPRPLPGPSPTTSQSKASGAPPRQSQSAGGPLRLSPPPLPIPAAHVQGTKPVGLRPAVSSVPKTPPNCRPKGEGDAAGGERHPYLNLFASFAGLLADTEGVAQVGQNQVPAGTRARPTQPGCATRRQRLASQSRRTPPPSLQTSHSSL